MEKSLRLIQNKNVIFISTKNKDYLRNTQEIKIISENAKNSTVIASTSRSYVKRIVYVYLHTLKHIIRNDFDIAFVGFAPQLILPLFFLIKKPIVIDFFISVFDTLVDDRKKVKMNTMTAKLIHYVDSLTLKKADAVICDTKAHCAYFTEEFHVKPEKCEVLYLEADRTIFYPRDKKKKEDLYRVLYFGSVLPVQGVDIILRAMKMLENHSKIRFIMIGPLDGKYLNLKRELTNVDFFDWLSQEQLAEKIADADLCLAGHFALSIGKADRTIAGKTFIYKAMDKPIVLGDSAANRELFKEDNQKIYYVPRGDAEALAKCIQRIAGNRADAE